MNQETTQPTNRLRRRRWWPWLAAAAAGMLLLWIVCVCVIALVLARLPGSSEAMWGRGDAVAVIYIEGIIGDGASGVDSAAIIDFIERADANAQVKAIVLYINSPGGSVVPSAEMYRAVRNATKPVVAVMGDVAASGGYYIAAAADKIVAHPASITGSIGVYSQMINAADLLDKLGVEGLIIRSGGAKAAGNWFEHPTPDQLAIEQAIVDELYAMFVRDVAVGRGMTEDAVRDLADGRPYTGQQALALKLIDALGNLQDGIEQAAQLGQIKGEPQIIEYRRVLSFWDQMLQGRQGTRSPLELWSDGRVSLPQMLYQGR